MASGEPAEGHNWFGTEVRADLSPREKTVPVFTRQSSEPLNGAQPAHSRNRRVSHKTVDEQDPEADAERELKEERLADGNAAPHSLAVAVTGAGEHAQASTNASSTQNNNPSGMGNGVLGGTGSASASGNGSGARSPRDADRESIASAGSGFDGKETRGRQYSGSGSSPRVAAGAEGADGKPGAAKGRPQTHGKNSRKPRSGLRGDPKKGYFHSYSMHSLSHLVVTC